MGFVLRLRGITCLHASAVAVGGRAIALLGPAGAGKSTTAAAFARLGHFTLSDDIVALEDRGDAFLAQPGHPRLCLWPESVRALYGSADALPRLVPAGGINAWCDKRYLDLLGHQSRFQPRPLPLAAVYILGERTADPAAPYVEAVPTQMGFIELVANTYMNYLPDTAARAREFEVLGRVMAGVPVRRVSPHQDPAFLPELCEAILADFHQRFCFPSGIPIWHREVAGGSGAEDFPAPGL